MALYNYIFGLVSCNDKNFVHNVDVTAPFSSSDHSSVEFNIIHDVKLAQADVISHDLNQFLTWVISSRFSVTLILLICLKIVDRCELHY